MRGANRIVSLVPSLTHTLFEMHLGDRIVGVTRYCVEPENDLPRIGGTKNPNLEKVADLQPDIVLVNTEENRHEDISWLRERFEVHESMPRTIADVIEMLRALGNLLDCLDEAEAAILEIQAQLTRIEVESLQRDRLRVFYPIWKDPWMSINGDTYIHSVLEAVGADNICHAMPDRYPVTSEDVLRPLETQLVLLPSEPYEFDLNHQTEILRSGLFPGCLVLLVDGRDFSWHGSRTGPALGRLHRFMLHHRGWTHEEPV